MSIVIIIILREDSKNPTNNKIRKCFFPYSHFSAAMKKKRFFRYQVNVDEYEYECFHAFQLCVPEIDILGTVVSSYSVCSIQVSIDSMTRKWISHWIPKAWAGLLHLYIFSMPSGLGESSLKQIVFHSFFLNVGST